MRRHAAHFAAPRCALVTHSPDGGRKVVSYLGNLGSCQTYSSTTLPHYPIPQSMYFHAEFALGTCNCFSRPTRFLRCILWVRVQNGSPPLRPNTNVLPPIVFRPPCRLCTSDFEVSHTLTVSTPEPRFFSAVKCL